MADASARRRIAIALLPLLVFLALALLFYSRLDDDASRLPSALVGRAAPQVSLPAVPGVGVPGWSTADLAGRPALVNVFGSWCAPCRVEHPVLMDVARERPVPGLLLVGINQRDRPENAAAFLRDLGNPFDRVGADPRAAASVEWGVYGVPETFVVSADGTVLARHAGVLTPDIVTQLLALLDR